MSATFTAPAVCPVPGAGSLSRSRLGIVTVVVGFFDPLFRRGLLGVLRDESSIEVVQVDFEDATTLGPTASCRPDVAILADESAPGLIPRLRLLCPRIEILVLAQGPTSRRRLNGSAARAACLPASASPGELIAAVHELAGRTRRLEAGRGMDVVAARLELARELLTARELEVLACVMGGQTHPEMADRLGITAETARTHTASIRRKLGAPSNRYLRRMMSPVLAAVDAETSR